MKKVLKATGNVVIIEQKKEEVTKSGIVIAQSALEGGSMEMFEGTVIAVGPSVKKIKKGDYVRFARNGISEFHSYGKAYLMAYEYAIPLIEKEVDETQDINESEFIVEDKND